MESTRISGVRGRESIEPVQETEAPNDSVGNSIDARAALNESENSAGLNSTFTVERNNHLKLEFNGLNHR